jgi:hypothetical protein
MTIQSSGQTIYSFSYLQNLKLGAAEEMYEVAGRASSMGLNWIEEVVDRPNE